MGHRRALRISFALASALLVGLVAGAALAGTGDSAGAPTTLDGIIHGGAWRQVWLSAAFREGHAAAVLPRTTSDRPDDVAGPQIHVIYALPSDGIDRSLDQDGTLDNSVASWNAWLAAQTRSRNFRLDISNGLLDITFVRLPETDAQFDANGVYIRDELERQLHALGFNQPQKIYLVYYDGRSSASCGAGPWPPDLPGNVAAMYLHGLYSGPVPCDTNPWGSIGHPGYLEFASIHEVLHTLGFVPKCAPHHTRQGHVSDSPSDLMWAGDAPWRPSTLDVGHDDYYEAHIPGCPDLSDSPYLMPVHSPPRPTISKISPSHGVVGQPIKINGKNLAGATDVVFDTTDAAGFTLKGNTITAVVSPGSTTGPVHVTTSVGQADGLTFTVDPSPVPTTKSFSPRKTHIGSRVSISGTGFWGASVVQVNGVDVQSFTVKSAKKISFVVAGGNTTGLISVTTPGGTIISVDALTIS